MRDLYITNSLSRTKELFTPLNPGHVGLYVCGHVTRRLLRRDENALHIWDCLVLMSRTLLLALLPLLAAAAVVEAYITPLVASLFF